ncbi:MAG: divalent-cation tolerance protein CutA [Candidatus Omnitrophota bacterium]
MHIVVFVTAANTQEARKIADKLIQDKLAACVNIVDNVRSLFWWEGKPDSAQEALLIVKSAKSKFPRIVDAVKSVHSYEVPEIIALPIISGEKKYLRWIDDSLRRPG